MRRQRGVALLVALLAVTVSVLLVEALLASGALSQARMRNGWHAEQARQLLGGVEAWAGAVLMADLSASGPVDGPGEDWARPATPIEIPGARIRGELLDLGGCFNVNALPGDSTATSLALQRFSRLLGVLRLPVALAPQAADFVDADGTARPGGAEDGAYVGLRVPNRLIADARELRRLPSMTPEAWEALAPYICAVPSDQALNLNTAAPVLWQALDERITPDIARRLARSGGAPYSSLSAVRTALRREGLVDVDLSGCGVGSRYFRLDARIDAGGLAFAYHSVMQRSASGVRVIARARGVASRQDQP